MSFDNWLRLLQIVALASGARWILTAGLAMRDGLHDLKQATLSIRGIVDDHEDRLRYIEGKPMRRQADQDKRTAAGAVLGLLLLLLVAPPAVAQGRLTQDLTSTTCPGSGCLVQFAVNGQAGMSIQVSGTFVGTIVTEATVEGTQWVPWPVLSANATDNTQAVTSMAAPGVWFGVTSGLYQVRVRMNAYTSGTARVAVQLSTTAPGAWVLPPVAPPSSVLSDALPNPTTRTAGVYMLAWDATNTVWRRVQVDAGTGTLRVDPGPIALDATWNDGNTATTTTFDSTHSGPLTVATPRGGTVVLFMHGSASGIITVNEQFTVSGATNVASGYLTSSTANPLSNYQRFDGQFGANSGSDYIAVVAARGINTIITSTLSSGTVVMAAIYKPGLDVTIRPSMIQGAINGFAADVDSHNKLLVSLVDGNIQFLAAPDSDGQAASSSRAMPGVASIGLLFNGATFDRQRGDLTNGLWANVKTSVLPTGAATETTLGFVKGKTDNLDVLLSTRLKPADTLTKVATVDTITNPVAVSGNVTVVQATGTNLHTVCDSGCGSAGLGQQVMAASAPVVIASNQTAVPVSGTVTTTPPANASTNVAQLAGTTTDTNSGLKSAGTLRVVLATDQPALTNKLLVTPDSIALPANQSVNVSQINSVTPLMGNGVTGTGSPRVTIASDNTAFAVNDVPPTLTKATQGATGFSTQDLKDAGRTALSFYANAIASGATGTETLITWTQSSGTGPTSAASTYTITNGKRFRIQNITVGSRGNATATTQISTFNLRLNTAGACTVTSTPILMGIATATPATASAWDRAQFPLPDGYEIAGNGTIALCISANAVFVTNAPTWFVNIIGYEY